MWNIWRPWDGLSRSVIGRQRIIVRRYQPQISWNIRSYTSIWFIYVKMISYHWYGCKKYLQKKHPPTLLVLELGLADFVCLKLRYETPAGQPETFLADHSVLYMYRSYLKRRIYFLIFSANKSFKSRKKTNNSIFKNHTKMRFSTTETWIVSHLMKSIFVIVHLDPQMAGLDKFCSWRCCTPPTSH